MIKTTKTPPEFSLLGVLSKWRCGSLPLSVAADVCSVDDVIARLKVGVDS